MDPIPGKSDVAGQEDKVLTRPQAQRLLDEGFFYTGPLFTLDEVRAFIGHTGDIEGSDIDARMRKQSLWMSLFDIASLKAAQATLVALPFDEGVKLVGSAIKYAERLCGKDYWAYKEAVARDMY